MSLRLNGGRCSPPGNLHRPPKGELIGLRKTDVDLEGGTVAVARSYEADTTKGARAALILNRQGLRPYIEQALQAASRSSAPSFSFPAEVDR